MTILDALVLKVVFVLKGNAAKRDPDASFSCAKMHGHCVLYTAYFTAVKGGKSILQKEWQ